MADYLELADFRGVRHMSAYARTIIVAFAFLPLDMGIQDKEN